ncbi:MAG TPA: hypothetical protein VFE24_17350 [Pirellulales bacterium]|jgi:hypothetical protein|nr:hypothetical protein [Pirellulales bacterium]
MQTIHLLRVLSLAALGLGMLALSQLSAQGPTTKSTPPQLGLTSEQSTEESKRAKILASERWKKVDAQYSQWLKRQAIYTPQQVNAMGAKLAAEIQEMPTEDLEGFLDDWDAKLKVLLGQNFSDAQDWLGYYMNNMADGYRRSYLRKLGLTDISKLSASELEDKIIDIRAAQANAKQNDEAANRSRQAMLQTSRDAIATSVDNQRDNTALRNTDVHRPVYQSPYRPPVYSTPPPPKMQFYVDGYGQIGYALPL